MSRVEVIGNATLYLGDCLEIVPALGKIDAVVTDPPYPDEHTKEYRYNESALREIGITKGMVFWSAKAEFPLPHSAIHIWDKKVGVQSEYECIYQIGGKKNAYKVFRFYLINSTVAARFTGDEFYDHPSQKPIRLMCALVDYMTVAGQRVVDPFMGSGTTGVACMNLGRKFIGIEIEPKYFDIACERIENAQRQIRMFA